MIDEVIVMRIVVKVLKILGWVGVCWVLVTPGYAEDKKITKFGFKLNEDREEAEVSDSPMGYTYTPSAYHFVFSNDQDNDAADSDEQGAEQDKSYIKKNNAE